MIRAKIWNFVASFTLFLYARAISSVNAFFYHKRGKCMMNYHFKTNGLQWKNDSMDKNLSSGMLT